MSRENIDRIQRSDFFFTAQMKCYTSEKYFQSSLALLSWSLFKHDYHVTDILILCKIIAQKVKKSSIRRQTTGTSYPDQKEQRILLVFTLICAAK